ncbi:MAG: hypothetical protein BWY68_00610 [bacterium ADurb.Bin400]|nr:MAG: hypothetical protein BWY68_00610 [bacterium ADurb.Bin400]
MKPFLFKRNKPQEQQKLIAQAAADPTTITGILQSFDRSNDHLDDSVLDLILGINYEESEKELDRHKLRGQYGSEQYIYEGTPYDYIRYFLHILAPEQTDIIYDLGSGYGRVVLYGALTTTARYKGIELIPERVERCNTIKNKISIENADFIRSNVLDHDYSDGTIFFLFNPFATQTLYEVGQRLEEIANSHYIRIVSWGGPSNEFLSTQPWLRENHYARDITDPLSRLKFYESLEA